MVGQNYGKQTPFRFVRFVSFSGQVMFFRQFAFCLASPVGEKWMRDEQTPKDVCGEATFCPFINYAYICAYLKEIWKKQFSGITSRGIKWDNKPYKLKRPIERLLVRKTVDWVDPFSTSKIQSNLFNTDTKGTVPSVRFTEVSVL